MTFETVAAYVENSEGRVVHLLKSLVNCFPIYITIS